MTDLTSLSSSFQRLADAARGLSDTDCRAPSRLPDWTRGHVLTHVARNADALVNLLLWARTGQQRSMYPSREARAADIEAGSGRSAAALVEDLEASQQRFEAAAAALAEAEWESQVQQRPSAPWMPASRVPLLRQGEVEIHHTDLGIGHEPTSWPADWVTAYLPYAAEGLDDRAGARVRLRGTDAAIAVGSEDPELEISGAQAVLVGWVVGRHDGSGLTTEPDQSLPELGSWR